MRFFIVSAIIFYSTTSMKNWFHFYDIFNLNYSNLNDTSIKIALFDTSLNGNKVNKKINAVHQDEAYDKVFTVVQIPAEFPGGIPAWTKFLERNLNRDLPVQNGAPAGKYTVVVSFIVGKDGEISDVQGDNDPGYGTKEEAVRVIKKGPSWKPAIQDGKNVIYRHKQSITYQVSQD